MLAKYLPCLTRIELDYVLRQYVLLSRCLSPPRSKGGHCVRDITFSNKRSDVQAMSILGVLVAMLVHLLIIYMRIKI